MVAALVLALAFTGPPNADFAAIDKAFVCPESLPDEKARIAALHDFLDAVTRAAPDKSLPEVLVYRRTLLQTHGCTQTLKSLDAADAAVVRGDVQDQAWFPLNSGLADVELSVSSSYLKLYHDSRLAGRAVETYARIDLTRPAQTNVTHVTYDQVVSHVVYYCQAHAYALIENDYFLAGRLVLKDPGPIAVAGQPPLYATTPTPPNSLNAIASAAACGATKGRAPA
jgi:hypothetical protein